MKTTFVSQCLVYIRQEMSIYGDLVSLEPAVLNCTREGRTRICGVRTFQFIFF